MGRYEVSFIMSYNLLGLWYKTGNRQKADRKVTFLCIW